MQRSTHPGDLADRVVQPAVVDKPFVTHSRNLNACAVKFAGIRFAFVG
jgi:hypothetical protein